MESKRLDLASSSFEPAQDEEPGEQSQKTSHSVYASGKGTVRTQANDTSLLASPELATLVHPNFDPLRPPTLTSIGSDTDSEYTTLQKLGRQSFKREA